MNKPKAKGAKPPKGSNPVGRAGKARSRVVSTGEEAHLQWNRKNYLILGVGGLVLIAGFLLLALGDTTVAPLLLVAGYLVLIPWGIVAARKSTPAPGHGKSP